VSVAPPVAVTRPSAAAQRERYEAAARALAVALPRHGRALQHARVVSLEPGAVKLHFPADAQLQRETILGADRLKVEALLSEHLGGPFALVEVKDAAQAQAAAPSAVEAAVEAESRREKAVDEEVRKHPAVKAVLKTLGGAVEHVRILRPESGEQSPATPTDEEP
jgi:hypothetical protein